MRSVYLSLLVISALFVFIACGENRNNSSAAFSGYTDVVVDSVKMFDIEGKNIHPVFSKDDKYLFFTRLRYEGIYRYELATGRLDTITSADRSGYSFAIDNDALFYVRYEYNAANKSRKSEVIRSDMSSGEEEIIYEVAHRIQGVKLHEDNQLSFFVRDSLFVYDTQTGSFLNQKDFVGQTYLISKGKIRYITGEGTTESTISENDNIVYVEPVSSDSLLVNLAKKGLFLFNPNTGSVDSMNTDFFPKYNGHDLYAYTYQATEGHKIDTSRIFIKSLSGDIETPVSTDRLNLDEHPAWSHNGRMLAYNNFNGYIKIAYLSYK